MHRELVIERAVPGSLPDRSFQRGLGRVWALFFSQPHNCSPVSTTYLRSTAFLLLVFTANLHILL
jgi:hypothetical protein